MPLILSQFRHLSKCLDLFRFAGKSESLHLPLGYVLKDLRHNCSWMFLCAQKIHLVVRERDMWLLISWGTDLVLVVLASAEFNSKGLYSKVRSKPSPALLCQFCIICTSYICQSWLFVFVWCIALCCCCEFV